MGHILCGHTHRTKKRHSVEDFVTQQHLSYFRESMTFSCLYKNLYGLDIWRSAPSSVAKRYREQTSCPKSGLARSIPKTKVGLNYVMTLGSW